MFSNEELKEIIRISYINGDYSNGGQSYFIQINNEVGIKIYSNRQARDASQFYQMIFSQEGFGPKVYGSYDLEFSSGNLYVYLTQVAEIDEDADYTEIEDKVREVYTKINLCFVWDLYSKNVGYIDGEQVIVDFGVGKGSRLDIFNILKEESCLV